MSPDIIRFFMSGAKKKKNPWFGTIAQTLDLPGASLQMVFF